MKCFGWTMLALTLTAFCHAQGSSQDISSSRLQTVLDLPLDKAVKQREVYKIPLKAAYNRQIAMIDKDCLDESGQGQQTYNICMGQASEKADKDFAIFYNNLQLLCHTQADLVALQAFEKQWLIYKESAMEAGHTSWPDGSGASGFAGEVYLALVRNQLRLLGKIYGRNISQ